ncbi:MAG: SMP-30/gluconolactonase/LRE family protein [Cyclobacteriaceae bacterium]|nr:SMP-30/gluconolactonase/LRE family protein [Cyclobacteriaceae bacterium]
MIKKISLLVLLGWVVACQSSEKKSIGSIERIESALDEIVSPDTEVEVIGEGFDWSEGPLWIESQKMLLFSDVPKNKVFKWTEEGGVQLYLEPSGYTSSTLRGGEMGSNGLLLNDQGNLVLCQHGDRRLAMMTAPISSPEPTFTTIANKFEGKRFSSPNDAVYHKRDYYFTDPPYGLEKQMEDPQKEISFQGVYRVSAKGGVYLLVDSLTRPNGLAFSPDGKYLVVANSDPQKARWYRYEMNDTTVVSGKVLYDATNLTSTETGMPDGLKIDGNGTIFATGPGGIFIMDLEGRLLGKIKLSDPSSNCALSTDEKTLYITDDMYLLRIKMR